MRYKNFKSQIPSPKPQGIQIFSCVLAVLLFFSFPARVIASAPVAMFDSAGMAYSNGDFEKAAQYYEGIISLGYESPEVYFNLGNSYYKLDKIGASVLNYERAKKLAPYDEDLNFNLKLANQRTLDKIEPAPKLFLDEWWDNLKSMHSEKTWGVRSIACFILFLFFLGVFITSNRLFSKQIGFWAGLVFFVFSLISFFVSKSRYNDITIQNSVVILSSSAEIKNAPADGGKKLFILHEGAKVAAPESKGDWVKIEFTPEKVGWVKRSSIEYI